MKKVNKGLIIIILILLIVLVILGIFALNKKNSYKVELKNDLNVELNSEVLPSDLIENIENGKVIDEKKIDTSELGKQTINIKIEVNNKEIDYKFDINVIDNEKPTIESTLDKITLLVNDKVDLTKLASVKDNSKEEIQVSIEGDYDFSKKGTYELKYVASDSSGNKAEKSFVLVITSDKKNYQFITTKDFIGEVKDGITYIDGVLIANKTYGLPSTYAPGLDKTLNKAYQTMQSDAKNDSVNLFIISGYRSYSLQTSLYNGYVEEDGKEEADRYSARPGYSEHQSGLAVDLNSVSSNFGNTKTGKWIANNCYKYGFILRYPKGKEEITGYMYESWHLRYVGKELASKLYNDGDWITLEEYFGIDSKYKD